MSFEKSLDDMEENLFLESVDAKLKEIRLHQQMSYHIDRHRFEDVDQSFATHELYSSLHKKLLEARETYNKTVDSILEEVKAVSTKEIKKLLK